MSFILIVPLIVAQLLKFILFLCISWSFSPDVASQVFVGMSISQILIIFTRGQIPAAKSELILQNIDLKQFNFVYKKYTYILLSIFAVVMLIAGLLHASGRYTTAYFMVGGLLGYLLMTLNMRQLLAEAHGTAWNYYVQICTYLLLIILSVIFFHNILLILLIIITLEIFFVSNCSTEKVELSSLNALGFKRIDILTNSAAALELPLIYGFSSAEGTVAYTLLLRLYSSVVTLSGQISRPLWKFGEWHNINIGSSTFRINVNFYFVVFFTLLILVIMSLDKLLRINVLAPLWSLLFAFYALIQVWNRYFKTKYLSQSKYGVIALSMQKLFIIYIVGMLSAFAFIPTVETIIISKICLAGAILITNIRKHQKC